MNPKNKFSKGKKAIKNSLSAVKDRVPDPFKKKLEKHLGVFMHKYHATLFYWDDKVQAMVFGGEHRGVSYPGIKPLADEGRMDEAREEGSKLQNYIEYKLHHSRKYQNKMDEIGGKMKDMGGIIKEKLKNMSKTEMLKMLKKNPEDLREDLKDEE